MTNVYSSTHRIKQPKISTHNQICTQNISAPSVRGSESTWQMLSTFGLTTPSEVEQSCPCRDRQTDWGTGLLRDLLPFRHKIQQCQGLRGVLTAAPKLSPQHHPSPPTPQHEPLACELTPGFYLQYLKWPVSSGAVREFFNQMKLSVRTNGFLCKTLGVNDHALTLLGANLVHDNSDPLTVPNPGLSLDKSLLKSCILNMITRALKDAACTECFTPVMQANKTWSGFGNNPAFMEHQTSRG